MKAAIKDGKLKQFFLLIVQAKYFAQLTSSSVEFCPNSKRKADENNQDSFVGLLP